MRQIVRIACAFTMLASILIPGTALAKEEAPLQVEGATTVGVDEAKALFDQGVLFIDPRGDADFDAGRIPGAVHLPLSGVLSESSLAEVASKDEPLVFYCNGIKCGLSGESCAKAVAWGYTNVHYFREGFPGWEAAGLPIE